MEQKIEEPKLEESIFEIEVLQDWQLAARSELPTDPTGGSSNNCCNS